MKHSGCRRGKLGCDPSCVRQIVTGSEEHGKVHQRRGGHKVPPPPHARPRAHTRSVRICLQIVEESEERVKVVSKANPEAEIFPLKQRDEAIAAGERGARRLGMDRVQLH